MERERMGTRRMDNYFMIDLNSTRSRCAARWRHAAAVLGNPAHGLAMPLDDIRNYFGEQAGARVGCRGGEGEGGSRPRVGKQRERESIVVKIAVRIVVKIVVKQRRARAVQWRADARRVAVRERSNSGQIAVK